MPRDYRQPTPGGDPSNPLSLMTTTMDIQQVSFTPQIAVAEPENQYVMLERILGLGAQAATNAYQYAAQANENEMALNAAIYREKQRQIDDAEIDTKKYQDGIFKRFDAEITAALLADEYDKANAKATQMAELYPVDENPDGNLKAQDHLLRIKVAREVYEGKQLQIRKQESAASQGIALFDSMETLERLQGQFNNPETRSQVMNIFGPQAPTDSNPMGLPGVPDDQLHVAINDMLMAAIAREKLPPLTPEDKVELQRTLLRQSDALRTGIIAERNRQRTFERIEKRTNAAITIATSMNEPTQDLDTLFTEFDQLEADKQAGLITPVQQTNLERNLVNIMSENLGKESPVSGALAMKQRIIDGVNEGRIPPSRGLRIVTMLERRALQELDNEIQTYEANLKVGVPPESQDNALGLAKNTDPGLEIGLNYGIFTRDKDGNIAVTPGNEKAAAKLAGLSQRWVNQREALAKNTGMEATIEYVQNASLLRQEYTGYVSAPDTAFTPEVGTRNNNIDALLMREINSAAAYAGQPQKQEPHILTSYYLITEELKRTTGVDLTPEQTQGYAEFRQLVDSNPAAAEEKFGKEIMGSFISKKPEERTDAERKYVYMTFQALMDKKLNDNQKRVALNPNERINDFSMDDYASMAQQSSTNLYKKKGKMSQMERQVEEEKTARLLAFSDTAPKDFYKYVGEEYFAQGSTVNELKAGYTLISQAKARMRDAQGNVINMATYGNVEAELAMYEGDRVMFDTISIAEAFSLGTNQPPEFFLAEAHQIAIRANAERDATKDRLAKGALEMIPPVAYDYAEGKPIPMGLTEERQRELRKAFKATFNAEVPEIAEGDQTISIDAEDYSRMNAIYTGFRARGYSPELAIRAATNKMKMFGYTLVVGTKDSRDERVQLIYDPLGNIPTPEQMNDENFKFYIDDVSKTNPNLQGMKITGAGKLNQVVFKYNAPDDILQYGRVPYTIIRPNGEAFYSGNAQGISRRGFEEWKARTTETQKSRANSGVGP